MAAITFCDINSVDSLIEYLKDPQRLNNVKLLSRYMRLSSALSLFSEKLMLINNPANMNDLYEYKAFSPKAAWSKICFSCFITQTVESMAMWSMYAQPWAEGVMVSVPTSAVKDLIRGTHTLIAADYNEETGRYSPGNCEIPSDNILSLSRVAYSDGKTITCTGRNDRNYHFQNPYEIPELAGYIKDSAWDYEKEVRLRVNLPEEYNSTAVYLKLPDEFLNQITITTGPRFSGNVLTALPAKYRPNVRIVPSKFKDQIAWIPCDSCTLKKQTEQHSILLTKDVTIHTKTTRLSKQQMGEII